MIPRSEPIDIGSGVSLDPSKHVPPHLNSDSYSLYKYAGVTMVAHQGMPQK